MVGRTVDHCILIFILSDNYSVCCDPFPDYRQFKRHPLFPSARDPMPFFQTVWVRHRVNAHHTRQRDRPPWQGPRAHEQLLFHLDKTALTDAFSPNSCLPESRQPMRAIKSPRLATHAVALQKQTRNAAVHLPPPGPFPVSHADGARKREARQFGRFFWSSHPPFFPARPPVPATGTPRLPCVSSLRH